MGRDQQIGMLEGTVRAIDDAKGIVVRAMDQAVDRLYDEIANLGGDGGQGVGVPLGTGPGGKPPQARAARRVSMTQTTGASRKRELVGSGVGEEKFTGE